MMKLKTFAMIAVLAFAAPACPAFAAPISAGTVTVADLFNPTINLTAAPNTYTATMGQTFELGGTGAFAGANTLNGVMDGTLSFFSVPGLIFLESIPNFFVFNDGASGTFNFSVDSVTTQNYSSTGASTAVALYILGSTLDAAQGLTATPTSLTLQFNTNGRSAVSSSASLSIPPSISSAPEPGTWLLMFSGIGLAGVSLRLRKTNRSKARRTAHAGGNSMAQAL